MGVCEQGPRLGLVYPIPCLLPGTTAWPPSCCWGQPLLHTSPQICCACGSVTPELGLVCDGLCPSLCPALPQPRVVPQVCLPRADGASSNISCHGLGSSSRSLFCQVRLWTETPSPSLEIFTCFLSVSGSCWVPLSHDIAAWGWVWGQGWGQFWKALSIASHPAQPDSRHQEWVTVSVLSSRGAAQTPRLGDNGGSRMGETCTVGDGGG